MYVYFTKWKKIVFPFGVKM